MGPVEEHTKTGIRMGLGVFITCSICYGLIVPILGPKSPYTSPVFNAGKAASITTVVVNAPLMGRISQVGLDRSIGTILGGVAGFLTVWCHYQFIHGSYTGNPHLGLMLSFAACIAAFGSVEAGWRIARLDTTPRRPFVYRLFTLTFLLVAFGTSGQDIRGDFVTLISRIAGILFGVFVSLGLAIVVFPKSATQESLTCMRDAFDSLIELSEAAWPKDLQDGDFNRHKTDRGESKYATSSGRALKGMPAPLRVNKLCEASLLKGLENSVSRVSRLIWALHLTFNEGISEHFAQILSQQYPRSLLPELQKSCQATLHDMADAFSSTSKIVLTGNLTRFTRAVEGLLRISDYHRREQLQAMKLARQIRKEGSPHFTPSSVPEGNEEGFLEGEVEEAEGSLGEGYNDREGSGSRAGPPHEGAHTDPAEAFWDLPKGLDIRVGPSRRSLSAARPSFRRQQSVEVFAGSGLDDSGSTRLTVKRVDPEDLLYFPESEEGLVAQIKWQSFLFLSEELVEGLQDAHANLTNLIATLPCNNIKL